MGRTGNINISRSLGEVDSNPHEWLLRGSRLQWRKWLKMQWKEKENQKWNLKCDWTANLMIKLEWMKSCFLLLSIEFGFLGGGIYSWWAGCEDCCNSRKDSDYYINLNDKAETGFEKTDSNFEKMFWLWVKCYLITLHCKLQTTCL